jgi:hypothetical protein
MDTQELLNTNAGADLLAALLPERDAAQWALWLRNNRNQSRRASYRIPLTHLSGAAFYQRTELEKFAEWEKARKEGAIKLTGKAAEVARAFGIGEQGGGAFGRTWKGATVTPGLGKEEVFIQTLIREPFMVFEMNPDEAEAFGRDLIEVARYVRQHNANKGKPSTEPDLSKYEIESQTADMTVRRLKKD